jgi:MFS family permease
MASQALREWKAGWPTVLAAGLGMAAGVSMFATAFGFFIVPLQHAFGWSRSQLATVSLAFFASSLTMPVVGALLDRWGSRVFVAIGAVAFAAVYVAFALNPGQLWFFYALLVAIGLLAAPCTMPTVFARPIVGQFDKSRGLALGIGLSGSYGMVVIMSPVLQRVIGDYGWRLGFGLLAGVSLVFGLTASALLRNQGPRKIASPSASVRRGDGLGLAARDPRFWLLAVAMVISNIPVGGVISQLQPMLSD